MKIEATRTFSTDQDGRPQSRELADLLASEQSREEIERQLASGRPVRFFPMPANLERRLLAGRDIATDGEGRPQGRALLSPAQVDAMAAWQYARLTGVPRRAAAPVLSPGDAAYADFAAACGLRNPASLRGAR